MNVGVRVLLLSGLLGVGSAGRVLATDDVLLKEAVRGNTSSVGSIRTLYGKVRFRVTPAGQPEPSLIYATEYWREPELIRIRQACERGCSGQVIDYEVKAGRQRAVLRDPGPEPNTAILGLLIARETRPTIHTNLWKLALIGLPPADAEAKLPLSLGEAVKVMRLQGVAAESGPNGRLVRVTLADEWSTYDVWLDPGVNWLIRKIVRTYSEKLNRGKSWTEYTVPDFTELSPGVFFPVRMTMRDYLNGELSVTHEAEFSEVRVNSLQQPPFPLKLPITPGMPVTDEIQGTVYEADAEGNPAGKVDALRYAPPPGAKGGEGTGPVPPTTYPAPSWARRRSTWLVSAALMMGGVAAWLIYRRRHSDRSA